MSLSKESVSFSKGSSSTCYTPSVLSPEHSLFTSSGLGSAELPFQSSTCTGVHSPVSTSPNRKLGLDSGSRWMWAPGDTQRCRSKVTQACGEWELWMSANPAQPLQESLFSWGSIPQGQVQGGERTKKLVKH
jgi:hypothetical protein